MVDKKITELTELTTPASADVVAIVDDPSGTPITKKITYANLEGNLSITGSQVSDFNASVNSNGSVVLNTTHRGVTTGNPHNVLATQITDFDTEVDNNSSVVANTAKVSNATHTGDVTGSIALTIGADKVNDTHIDFGTGANQVNTGDLPESGNLYFTDARVNSNGSVVLNTSHRTGDGSDHADVATNTGDISTLSGVVVSVSGAGATHEADTSNPHGTTLTQTNIDSSGTISGTTLSMTVGDHGNASGAQVVNVVYSSGATPPTASTTTEGTLFVQYTA